jgi:hypothetical protein
MAVGTRRFTVRLVASFTALTLTMVVPTTAASSAQSTLKPQNQTTSNIEIEQCHGGSLRALAPAAKKILRLNGPR